MPTSNGLSHSTCSLPRKAWTIGAPSVSANATTSSCAPAQPLPHNSATRFEPSSSAASASSWAAGGTLAVTS